MSFDSFDGNNVSAIGTTTNLTGNPFLVAGKHGNAIYFANTGTFDDTVVDLGLHTNHCVDNFSKCTRGWTMAFWFFSNTPGWAWPHLVGATSFNIWGHCTNDGFQIGGNYFPYMNSTGFRFPLQIMVPFDNWIHVAMVFDGKKSVDMYINGCAVTQNIKPDSTITERTIQFGCTNNEHCGPWTYDELYIWEEQKAPWFIWQLYSQ